MAAIIMLGPLLIRFGTAEQRQRFLPRILTGEHVWCQGYSEPGAGSDLGSLRTEAVLDGDHYVVNGQKTWTTLATDANWIFCLVRTDRTAKKQEGISFLLIDMASPGVTVRPIINLGLHDEFCEVLFDAVRVPRENLVGEPNKGWSMAKALLGFERIFLGSPRRSSHALSRLKLPAERMGVFAAPEFQIDTCGCASISTITKRQGAVLGALIQGFKVNGRDFAGTSWDWLTPFSVLTGVALMLGYGLLGAGWLMIKTEGALQAWARRTGRVCLLGVLAAILAVSIWTPLADPLVAQRWFTWPGILLLSPVPVLTALIAIVGWRAVGLFLMSYLGIAVSCWSMIVPGHFTLHQAASSESTQAFLLIGTLVLIPVILMYTAWSYWVFRGKMRGDIGYH